jgi:deazaflavin-dependent oxidoreductase (nitroreductase family)
MVAPRALARFNRRVTNPVLGRLVPLVPGFAMIEHTGRRSGRAYRTPVNLFRHGDGYVVALTYGPTADWVRNVLAAGECDAVIRGRSVHLVRPRVVHDPQRQTMPAAVRPILGVVGVDDFLELDPA